MSLLLQRLTFIKRTALALFGFLLLLLTLAAVLLFTHPGNQFTIRVAEYFEPRLSVDLEQGSFFNSPRFSKISWLDQQAKIQIASASYEFDWSCLLQKICIQQIAINDAQIIVAGRAVAADKKTATSASSAYSLPIEVAIAALDLKKIHLSVNNIIVDLASLHLQAVAKEKELTLNSVIDGLTVQLPVKSTATQKSPGEQKTAASIPALLSQQDLPEIKLPFNLHVAPITVNNFTLTQGDEPLLAVNALNTRFNFSNSQLTISSLTADLPETDLQLAGALNFSGNYPLNMQLKGHLKSIKQLQPAEQLSGQSYNLKSSGDLSQLNTELLLSDKISMQLSAQIDLLKKNLPHRLTLTWQKLRWPLTGKAQYSSAAGSLQSSGAVNDYRIKLNGVYQGASIPDGELSLAGKGNLQQLNIEQLLLKTLDGSADLSGLLNWQGAIRWDGQLAIDKIDLAKLHTQYSGNFSGLIKQQAQLTFAQRKSPSWRFSIPEMDIHGQFLARPFAVSGMISGDDKQGLNFQNVLVKNAENRFLVNGLLAKQNDLNIKLNIADLSHTLLGSSGSIKGEVKIQGRKDALTVKSNLHGALLSYQNTRLNAFQLVSKLLVSEKPALSLQLTAKQLRVDKQIIDDLAINIRNISSTGTANEHQIELSVNSKGSSTQMTVALIQENKAWLGRLSAATINLPEQRLTLHKPFAVVFENRQALIAPHCWDFSTPQQTNTGKLCVKKLNIGRQGGADLAVDSYLLANLDPYLPKEFKMTGAISADAQIQWNETEKPSFAVNLFAEDMRVKVNHVGKAGDRAGTYPVQTFNISLVSNKNKSDLAATIYSQNLIFAKIQGQLFPYHIDPTINAQLDIELPDVSPFSVLVPELEKLTGQAKTALTVTGPLVNPKIDGRITITDASIIAAALPVQVNHLNGAIVLANNSATIDGAFYTQEFDYKLGSETRETIITDAVSLVDKSLNKVRRAIIKEKKVTDQQASELDNSEPGKVNIKGTFDWQKQLQGELHFFANQMTVSDYDKFELLVSPDLYLNIAEQIKLSGKVLVNRGKITIKELPAEAISPSKDVIVVDIKRPQEAASLPVAAHLQVDLGQQLKVQAIGLDTTVKGNLLVRKSINKNPTIDGDLALVDGSYRALGQQLVLQKSRIIFQGPVDSPYISIEAIRDPKKIADDVTAGVRVTGTPDQLSLVVFSDPAMAQQEALSYIIRGKSLQNSSDSEGNSQIASLLINLGADQTAAAINEIGNTFGIKDLSLSASGSGEEQSVGLSGYIAPRVELSYGVGVFDSFSILAIRYEMFERFYIEASSGLAQAVDAYYEFDWD